MGGGDSALEAALAISEQADAKVILSYRSEAFSRVKEKNRLRIQAASDANKIKVLFNSNVKQINPDHVIVAQGDQMLKIKNDAVIVSAGGILPTY